MFSLIDLHSFYFIFYFINILAALHGLKDLSSLTKDRICVL